MAPHAVLSGNRHSWAQTIRHSPSRPSRQGCGHGTLMLVERLQTIPAFGHGGPTHKRGPRKERGRAGCRAGWPGRARPEQEPTSWEKSCAREDTGTSVSTRRTWYTIALRHAQLKELGRPRYGNPRAGLTIVCFESATLRCVIFVLDQNCGWIFFHEKSGRGRRERYAGGLLRAPWITRPAPAHMRARVQRCGAPGQ